MVSTRCKPGEKRAEGFLYFVKGKNLEIWKAKMARGGKRKKAKKRR